MGSDPRPGLDAREAAIWLGVSPALLHSFTESCPKPDEHRRLRAIWVDGEPRFDRRELAEFARYLRAPWPRPGSGRRPIVTRAMWEDLQAESGQGCAVCGRTSGLELAHIVASEQALDNSPLNLLLLCDEHHAGRAHGFVPGPGFSHRAARTVKRLLRRSRRQALRLGETPARWLLAVGRLLDETRARLARPREPLLREAYATASRHAVLAIADHWPGDAGAASAAEARLAEQLAALQDAARSAGPDWTAQLAPRLEAIAPLLLELRVARQLVACPRCDGGGSTGLVGDLCATCGGACYVTPDRAQTISPEAHAEQDCPHCRGSGTVGRDNRLCSFCCGAGLLHASVAAEYVPPQRDEVPCPRCGGSGKTGLAGQLCALCRGSGAVSWGERQAYDPDALPEAACPHCGGGGKTGLSERLCAYCEGACFVPEARAAAYDPALIDEVPCPACDGGGETGLVDAQCPLCEGECVVSRETARAFTAR